ncbi:hypothetical protein NSA47_07600 [Irregularibacter muris]|uniref:Glycosyl hydrolase n=1 Tax=Irregularibacter muris TaxID=1796619 RepID=A0AAE3L3U3_9FIRM|nr:hypothetical protein [Irregularibacter muris]MCR1898848.1 hypothetical protein [Irregularibacter muris]
MKKKNILFWAKALNPVILLIYGIACFYLVSLAQYGGVKRRVPVILGCVLFLFLWFFWCIYNRIKQSRLEKAQGDHTLPIGDDPIAEDRIKRNKIWLIMACVIFLTTSLFTGINLYKSGTAFQGKLSWFIHDLKNKREIKFVHNNLYEDHLEGIFQDIEKKVSLPEELYVSSDFTLKFKKDGKITSFDTYLYGKDKKGKTQSFLLSYNEKKSDKITLYLRGYVKDEFDEKQKLQPLKDMVKRISIKEKISPWNEETYGLLYRGLRSWGYNHEGIYYVNGEGNITPAEPPQEEIIGYTLSIYAPGKEDVLTPLRFIDTSAEGLSFSKEKSKEEKPSWDVGYHYNEGEETFFLDENLGYQLSIVDAALGSRFYALLKTQDGGTTWDTINPDPYLGDTGVSAGITFIDEDLGFIALSHSGGDNGELYRTEDGGTSYKKVSIPSIEVPLTEEKKYNPFDYPEMPYEENGILYLLIGQGQDGDYNGGIKALYQSKDDGKTWEYVEEIS